ncbi:hypothetical protein NUH86_19100 [Sphingobium sp. JS3065]|uniref:hypothetical protein n=1 Tax=Sphingobium sp. JS3065 TaxID=2970925 RepID=UPI0022650736|nr:hypothetical protein [Sphingobium sp. JS3065]UZW57680.1 hypothetical protein NUH86_19100 [Sphingobium sp. JS3065]
MGRGIPIGAPTLVILMAATMPAMAAKGQAMVKARVPTDWVQPLAVRQQGGEFIIEAVTLGQIPPAPAMTVPLGRSIRFDPALLARPFHDRKGNHDVMPRTDR